METLERELLLGISEEPIVEPELLTQRELRSRGFKPFPRYSESSKTTYLHDFFVNQDEHNNIIMVYTRMEDSQLYKLSGLI